MRTERSETLLAIHMGWINAGLPATTADDPDLQALVSSIRKAFFPATYLPIFTHCLQDPFKRWDVCLMALNHAAFFYQDGQLDLDALMKSLHIIGQRDDTEIESFTLWMTMLPEAVRAVQSSPEYKSLRSGWNALVDGREAKSPHMMEHLEDAIRRFFGPDAVENTVFLPNPLQTPQIGCCIQWEGTSYLTSSLPNAVAIRALLRPTIFAHRALIEKHCRQFGYHGMLDEEKLQQEGASLGDDERLLLVVDCFARGLSLYLLGRAMGQSLDTAAERHQQSGYLLAEPVYQWAMFLRPTQANLPQFLEELLFRFVKSRDTPKKEGKKR